MGKRPVSKGVLNGTEVVERICISWPCAGGCCSQTRSRCRSVDADDLRVIAQRAQQGALAIDLAPPFATPFRPASALRDPEKGTDDS